MQIIEDGILATNIISDDVNHPTDNVRYDNHPSYICCSVEFPNVWYLERTRANHADELFNDWVIVLIRPEVIQHQPDTKCSAVNAAKNRGGFIEYATKGNIQKLFADNVDGFPRYRNLPSCYASNAQAEILIKDIVPREFIYGVCVQNENMAVRIQATLKTLNVTDLEIYISPDMFDKNAWKSKVVEGIDINETRFA